MSTLHSLMHSRALVETLEPLYSNINMATSGQMSCEERPQRNCAKKTDTDRMGILRKKEAKEKEKEVWNIIRSVIR